MAAVIEPAGAGATFSPASLATLRARVRDGKEALIQRFRDARPTAPATSQLLRGLAHHVDETLQELWQNAGMSRHAALVAVSNSSTRSTSSTIRSSPSS